MTMLWCGSGLNIQPGTHPQGHILHRKAQADGLCNVGDAGSAAAPSGRPQARKKPDKKPETPMGGTSCVQKDAAECDL